MTPIRYVNIIAAALLAGISFGIWIGFNPSHLSAPAYIEQQQNMLQSLRKLLIALVVFTIVITLISAYIQKADRKTFTGLLVAAGFLLCCILITQFGNKPIDNVIVTWTSNTIPVSWMELRDKWWTFHILRTIAELSAFLIITWTSLKKENERFFVTN